MHRGLGWMLYVSNQCITIYALLWTLLVHIFRNFTWSLYFVLVSPFLSYTFFMWHFSHVFFFMLYSFHVFFFHAGLVSCGFLFFVAILPCSTLFMIHFVCHFSCFLPAALFYVALFYVALFSFCAFFMLHYFHDALFSCFPFPMLHQASKF